MQNKTVLSIILSLHITFCHFAEGPMDSAGGAGVDREQRQLEWCFVYSNLLGYNINYVSNPRLYQCVGEWMGTPYRYSGSNKNGIDCSSLVSEIYRVCYEKTIDGCSKDLYKNVDPVRRADLHEGDLVFFKIKKNKVSHVGIYLGQNKFVHSSTQLGVTISDLDDPYYQKYYFKGGPIRQ